MDTRVLALIVIVSATILLFAEASQPKREALAAILLVIGLAGCNRSPTPGDTGSGTAKASGTQAQDVAELKALEDRFMTAFRAKDVDALMQLCVPDNSLVVFDVHPPRQYNGAQAYRKDWEDTFGRFSGPIEADISEVNVTASGDVAFIRSIHRISGTLNGGKKVNYTVRVTDGFKKIDGKWLIVHSHISFPVDPQTGKADMESKP